MKLNRLLEITTVLLNKKTVTAAELAERFGVSTRTIYRDIDALSASGIPVYSSQGAGGGISILEDFSFDRAALSASERDNIMAALQALKYTKYPEVEALLDKLSAVFRKSTADWISIDFSPWGSNLEAYNRFTDIRTAILQSRVIEIEYINSFNEKGSRSVEPLRLVFKSRAWYLWAYCLTRRDYRTFRVSRIKKLRITETNFDRALLHEAAEHEETPRRPLVDLVLRFSGDVIYRLADEYDDSMLVSNGDGTYTVEVSFPEDEWVYSYILGYGTSVEVIKPERIRNIIRERAANIAKIYSIT